MLKFLKAFWTHWRSISFPAVPEWEVEDQRRLLSFLETETGQKLKAILRASAITGNASAVSSGNAHQCGYATGFSGAIVMIEGHAMPRHTEPEELDTSPDLAHLSP